MKKYLSVFRLTLLLAALYSALPDQSMAQENSLLSADKSDLLAACHIHAAMVNLGEAVYWTDLESCNQLLQSSGQFELDADEHLASLLNRAILLTELTEFVRARQDLEQALLIAPESAHIQLNLGLLNMLERDYDQAVINFTLAAEEESLAATALYNQILARAYAGNRAQAVRELEMFRSLYPQEFTSWIAPESSEFFPELLALLAPIAFPEEAGSSAGPTP